MTRALLLLGLVGCGARDADDFLERELKRSGVPGMSVATIADGDVTWSAAYGLADRDAGTELTEDHALLLASVSKTVTAVALLQVWEEGGFELDDDVRADVGFPLASPAWPDTPITYRQLLTHSAGIRDNWSVLEAHYVEGDSPESLGGFLEDYLSKNGAEYDRDRNFHDWKPGTRTVYSNVGAALAGYMVEVHTGIDFADYCEARIFEPLGLEHTGWHLADFADVSMVASPHRSDPKKPPVPHFGFPDYPDGQLRSSARDMARFLGTIANDGTSPDGVEILEAETVAEMLRVQQPAVDEVQGLIWYWERVGGTDVVGHNGGEVGTSTDMYFDPEDGAGFVMLMNGVPKAKSVRAIHERLLDEAKGR